MGYNGSPPGCVHCDDQTLVDHGDIAIADLPRNETRGCLLNGEGRCIRTIHAEINALVRGAALIRPVYWPDNHPQATLYSTAHPCLDCLKACIAAGVKRVVHRGNYLVGSQVELMVLFLEENKGVIEIVEVPKSTIVGTIKEPKL